MHRNLLGSNLSCAAPVRLNEVWLGNKVWASVDGRRSYAGIDFSDEKGLMIQLIVLSNIFGFQGWLR
jgi:hypothetical protein